MRPKQRSVKELRVGALVLLAVAVIVATVFSIGGQRKMFGDKVNYKILFNATGGLYVGDPVLLTGVEIGNVSQIGFPPDIKTEKIFVEIAVLKDVAPRIRKNSRARIAAASLVYGKVVELTMGNHDEPAIPTGEYIEAIEPTNYNAVVDSTNLMVDDIRQVLWKLNRGDGALAAILNEPLEVRNTLHHLSVSTEKLAKMLDRADRGEGALGSLLTDTTDFKEALHSFNESVLDFQTVTTNLKGKESVAGRLINDAEYGDALMSDLRSAIRSLASVAAKIDTGGGTLGRLINEEEMFLALQDVVLGVQSSKLSKWIIQNRRKAGERERQKQIKAAEKEGR